MVQEKKFAETKEIIKEGKSIVDIYATWCGPCKMLAPLFEKVSTQHEDIKFIKICADDEPGVAEWNVSSIPALIFFKDGQEMGRITGMQTENSLNEKIKEFFN